MPNGRYGSTGGLAASWVARPVSFEGFIVVLHSNHEGFAAFAARHLALLRLSTDPSHGGTNTEHEIGRQGARQRFISTMSGGHHGACKLRAAFVRLLLIPTANEAILAGKVKLP